jgi:hypothetical protein
MANASNPNKVTRLARINQAIAGIQQFFMTMSTIVLGGKSYTPGAVVTLLQSATAAIALSSNKKAEYVATVQSERNTIAQIAPVLRYLKTFVVTQFGDTPDSAQKLEVFGLSPRKPRSKNVQVKAAAADKVVATRKARNTMGPKQKAKIHGTPAPEPQTSGPTAPAPAVKPTS